MGRKGLQKTWGTLEFFIFFNALTFPLWCHFTPIQHYSFAYSPLPTTTGTFYADIPLSLCHRFLGHYFN